jgi:DNA repair exonuclease SbcCD ATPase subunit
MRRLLSAEIHGFRAFGGEYAFDLDADVVILSGPNGSEKTSLFDAILWSLSGQLPRFAGRKAQAISLYSPSGSARVAVTFEDDAGQQMTVIRTASSEDRSDVLVETATDRFDGSAGDVKILETLWPSGSPDQGFGRGLLHGVHAQCVSATGSRSGVHRERL